MGRESLPEMHIHLESDKGPLAIHLTFDLTINVFQSTINLVHNYDHNFLIEMRVLESYFESCGLTSQHSEIQILMSYDPKFNIEAKLIKLQFECISENFT